MINADDASAQSDDDDVVRFGNIATYEQWARNDDSARTWIGCAVSMTAKK